MKGGSAETTDVKYDDYVLSILTFDLFIDLFVPFTALIRTTQIANKLMTLGADDNHMILYRAQTLIIFSFQSLSLD